MVGQVLQKKTYIDKWSFIADYTMSHKNGANLALSVTSSNVDGF